MIDPLKGPQTFEQAQTAVSDCLQEWRDTEYEDHPGRTYEHSNVHHGWVERGQGKAYEAAHADNPVLIAVRAQRAAVPLGTAYTEKYKVGGVDKEVECLHRKMVCKKVTAAEQRRAQRQTDADWQEHREAWLPDLPADYDHALGRRRGAPAPRPAAAAVASGGCKWCGSATHKRKSHKDCPHNPKRARASAPAPQRGASTTDTDTSNHDDRGWLDDSSEEEDEAEEAALQASMQRATRSGLAAMAQCVAGGPRRSTRATR
eukprot:COSAG01_NODE_18733_length_1056_cov_8.578892_1_plen_260_part_00